jgi:hypothetical protein
MKRIVTALSLLLGLGLALPAVAAPQKTTKPAPKPAKPGKSKVQPAKAAPLPPGTVDSGVISIDQVSKLQNIRVIIKGPTDKSGQAVVVRTVLPDGWTYVENGRKKNSAELDPEIGVYTLLAKPPTKDAETDFAYELRVYPNNLTAGPFEFKDAKGNVIKVPEKDRNKEGMLRLYLDAMISEFIRAEYKTSTSPRQMKPVAYGVVPDEDHPGQMLLMGTRPEAMYFVPIAFTHPKTGETIFTFTGVIGDKIVALRFLVAKDQEENYRGTIAYIINNTWGLTLDQDSQWAQKMQEKIKAGEAAVKQQSGNKPPSKGGKTN